MTFFWPKKKQPILVVDDSPDILILYEDILKSQGYEVACAPSGEDALRLAKSEPLPLAILLDIMMPKVDGLAVLAALRANPKTVKTPVIMLTALQHGMDVEKAFALGANGYIIKPATPDRILRKLAEVLSDSAEK